MAHSRLLEEEARAIREYSDLVSHHFDAIEESSMEIQAIMGPVVAEAEALGEQFVKLPDGWGAAITRRRQAIHDAERDLGRITPPPRLREVHKACRQWLAAESRYFEGLVLVSQTGQAEHIAEAKRLERDMLAWADKVEEESQRAKDAFTAPSVGCVTIMVVLILSATVLFQS